VVLDFERLPIKIELRELKPGVFFEAKDFSVSAFPVTHRGGGCFGFVFQEHDRRPFIAEKAQELGVPAGPERGQLVKGEAVTLADGQVITPEMVLGDEIPGAKLVVIGDVGRTDNILEYVEGADTLVIESTFLEEERSVASSFGHITARQAAEFARDAGVRSLLLTHVSRRYREGDVISEARRVRPDAYVVRDLDHFEIRRGDSAMKVVPEST
jgi:ribonuclease Z